MLILVAVSVSILIDSDLIGTTEQTVAKWNEAADKEKQDIDKLMGELGNITQDQCTHQYEEWEIIKEATCTEEGSKTAICTQCNYKTTEIIEATGHTYETGVCTVCGHELDIPDGIETGAIVFGDVQWDSGIAQITVSTETEYKIQYQINNILSQGWTEIANNGTIIDLENGDTVYARLWNGKTGGDHASADIICTHDYTNGTCTICGITCEHDYGSWTTVKAATCTEEGTEQRTCSICTNSETQSISATGHSYSETGRVASTCTTAGKVTYTCSGCNDSYDEGLALLSHTVVTDAAVSATCTTSGLTEGSHCSVCNTVITAQQTVPATGHQNTTIINASETYTGDTYCNDCKTTIETGEAIAATVTVTLTGTGYSSYAQVTIDGNTYSTGQNEEIKVAKGTVITLYVKDKTDKGVAYITVYHNDGTSTHLAQYETATCSYTVNGNIRIQIGYEDYDDEYGGRIYIYEE